MFADEYSSMWSSREADPAETLEEHPKRRDLLFARAWSAISRAAMLSSAAQARIISTISRFVWRTTRMPRRGTVRTKPSCESIAIASRIGVRETPMLGQLALVEHDRLGRGVDVHLGDGVLQGRVGFALEARLGRDAADDEAPGLAGKPVGLAAQRPFQLGSI